MSCVLPRHPRVSELLGLCAHAGSGDKGPIRGENSVPHLPGVFSCRVIAP